MTFTEKIKAIKNIIQKIGNNPSAIFWVLKDEEDFRKRLIKSYGYERFRTIDIRNFLNVEETVVNHYTFLDGTSMLTDHALLKSIAEKIQECEYLEIGTWRGESILNVADTNANCTSINLSKDDILKSGIDKKYAELNGCLITEKYTNIKRIYADSMKFDFSTLNKKFDLIFVDGDHSYNAVKSDTANVFKLLRDENSVIVWHDYGYNPEKPRYSTIAGILDGLPEDALKHLYHVSNTMCAVYTKKSFESVLIDPPTFPEKIFNIRFSIKPNEK